MQKLLTLLLFIVVMMIPYSCEKDKNNNTQISTQLLDKLNCMGLQTENASQDGPFLTIEEDIILEQSAVELAGAFDPFAYSDIAETEERQYAMNNSSTLLVSLDKVNTIKYYIDSKVGTMGGQDWVTAINTATADWTNVPNCRVKFIPTTSQSTANLTFFASQQYWHMNPIPPSVINMGEFDASVAGRACTPQNGNVGRWICCNIDLSMTLAQKKKTMRHEIGHALGLRHNNAVALGEGASGDACGNTYPAPSLISGTPVNDPSSCMISGFSNNTISANDMLAMQYLYPDNYGVPVINSSQTSNCGTCGASGPNSRWLTINTNASPQPPFQVIIRRYNTAGTLLQTEIMNQPGTANSFQFVCPIGTWKFNVQRRNYGIGNAQWVSAYKTITVQ